MEDGPEDRCPNMFAEEVCTALGASNTDWEPVADGAGLLVLEPNNPGVIVALVDLDRLENGFEAGGWAEELTDFPRPANGFETGVGLAGLARLANGFAAGGFPAGVVLPNGSGAELVD